MQLTTNTMAYSNEMSLALPPMLKGTSGGGAYRMHTARNAYGKQQHRGHPKSQPFDPEDLRRRLYVVIAEREAQNERRQRQRVDALPAKRAQVERERDIQHLFIERLAATADRPADSKATSRWSGSMSRSNKLQSSRQDKLRHRASMTASSESTSTTTDRTTSATGGGYRHIPEQAAAQFSRTTTSTGMQGGDSHKSLVHSLSRAALRFYTEGPSSSADRRAIDTSITPGKQRSLLQRGRAQQEKQHSRNQFQDPAAAAAATRSHQPGNSKSRLDKTARAIEEEDERANGISALADLHLHTFASQSSGGNGRNGNSGSGGEANELHSSEETLVDATAANEHRVDWSQSDELLPHERRGMKLLRKTTSILTMKLGGHRRKSSVDSNSETVNIHIDNSGNGGIHHQNQQQQQQQQEQGQGQGQQQGQQLRIVTIHEHCDEQAEADADDGSTPMSPKSGHGGRTGRIGIWERLKRG